MEENVAQSVAQPRFRTILLTIFAVVALVIAAVGIYGVMAYALLQRSREIGIRMALGCSSEGIFLLILNDGMRLTGIGVIIGTATGLCGRKVSEITPLRHLINRRRRARHFNRRGARSWARSIVPPGSPGASRIEVAQIMRES